MILHTKGKYLLPYKMNISKKTEEELKEKSLEPEPEKEIKGNGLSELRDKLQNLSLIDIPVKPVIKGERKKRNISFTY